MIPEERLSSQPVVDNIIGGRGGNISKTLDKEDGPRYVANTDYGLFDQIWEGRLTSQGIKLSADTVEEFLAYSYPDIQAVSFTFDQNGRYVIVTSTATTSGTGDSNLLYWYDPMVEAYVTLDLGFGLTTPVLFLDDKRESQTNVSDIILFYISVNNLCYRQQRDRFLVEKVLASPANGKRIVRVGMNRGLRIQIHLE